MSNFLCQHCGTAILEGPDGRFVTCCVHHPLECSALHKRTRGYVFGDRVPIKVRMLKTVTADPMPYGIGFKYIKGSMPPVAIIDTVLPCKTNSFGAVSVVFQDGEELGVKPDEFVVVEWFELGEVVE